MPFNNLWTSYGEQFKQGAFQLVLWGYQGARNKFGSDSAEEVISGHIVKAMKDKLSDLNTPDEFVHFFADCETPVHSSTRIGKQRRRIDIFVESSAFRPRLKYFFEAKRLKRPTFRIPAYVGKDGMELFIDGEYAAEEMQGGMIGYVQSDAPSFWEPLLDKAITDDKRKKLSVTQGLTRTTVIPSLSDTWLTGHRRANGTDLVLYHLFFDCT